MKKRVFLLGLTLIFSGWVDTGGVQAQSVSPSLSINLVLNKSRYIFSDPSDPINAQITLRNTGSTPIVTTAGFSQSALHLLLTFIDPGGKGIAATELQGGGLEPLPPNVVLINGVLVQVEEVEVLPVGFVKTVNIPDVRQYYALTTPGRYSVKTTVPLRTYPSLFTVGGVNVAPIDAFNFAGAIESNTLRFSLLTDVDQDSFFSDVDCDDSDPAVNPGKTEIPGDSKDNDCNPATPDAVDTPVQALQHVIDSLNTIFLNNPGRRFTDELREALERARQALGELNEKPPDNDKAIDRIKQVVDKIDDAIDDGLDLTQGRELMDGFTGIARQIAVDALNKAIAQKGNPTRIKIAKVELVIADKLREHNFFEEAVFVYGKVLDAAEAALPKGKK
jgi:hypothetical protein